MANRRVLDSPWLYFAGAVILIALAGLSQVQYNPTVERPIGSAEDLRTLADRDDLNIVFIVIDMLRADRLTSYDYARNTAPNLDALARTGILFESVESQSSWTKASMASMWLGQYPETTGIQRYRHGLSDAVTMPAEILRDAGWRTGGVWRNGWIANNFGFGQGFELYFRPPPVKRPGMQRGSPGAHLLMGTDYDATEAAIGYMESNPNERFFLYIHYMDVHQFLYADTSPAFGSTLSDFYDASIHWVDRNVAFVYNALKERGMIDRTLIVIASDHGESFFEHGQEGHARTLFREVQEVPLIIVPPFIIPGGLVVEDQVANVDIWPTVLDLAGAPELPNADGRSLLPLMLAAGGADAPEDHLGELQGRSVFSQLDMAWGKVGQPDDPLTSMVKKPYRIIVNHGDESGSRLYDHSQDPREQKNLGQSESEIYAEMRAEVDAFIDSKRGSESVVEPDDVEMTEMRLHQLRALGYVLDRHAPLEQNEEAGAEEDEEASGGEDEPSQPADDAAAAPGATGE